MNYAKHVLAGLLVAVLMSACGGGKDLSGGSSTDAGSSSADGSTSNDETTSASPILSLKLMSCVDAQVASSCSEQNQLPAQRANRISVRLTDAGGAPLKNAIIAASSDRGVISPDKQLSDDDGQVSFLLSADQPTDAGAGTVTVSYTDDSTGQTITAKQNFAFVAGSNANTTYQLKLLLQSCTDISDSTTCTVTANLPTERASLIEATLLDPQGNPVPEAIIQASTNLGSIQPATTRLTDDNGQTRFLLVADTDSASRAGTLTLTSAASEGGVSSSKNFQFGQSNLALSLTADQTSLPAGSVAVLTASVTLNGEPYTTSTEVSFTSSCASNGSATLDSKASTILGEATATYKGTSTGKACNGNDTITATLAGSSSASAQVTISNQQAAARTLVAGTPSQTFIYVRGSGKGEQAQVTFTLRDEQGFPIAGKQLDFSFGSSLTNGSAYDDYLLSPTMATTDGNGSATVNVNSGSVPVPLRVVATLHEDTDIRAASSQIGVGMGYPDDNSFSFAADSYNIEGWELDGVAANITLRLADRFNNPVPDGTKVYLTTEGGSIAGNETSSDGITGTCSTINGACNATLTAQDPRPKDGRVTVTAYVEGEESFWDFNGNGLFDKSELPGVADDQYAWEVPSYAKLYTDIGEVFHNLSFDDDNSPDIDADGYRVNVDTFVDLNSNGRRDLGDGKYTGLACSQDTVDRGFCQRGLVQLFRNVEFVFTGINNHTSGSIDGVGILPIQQCTDINDESSCTDVSSVDLTTGPAVLRFYPAYQMYEGYSLLAENPIPAGSSIGISQENGGTLTAAGISYDSPYPSTTRPFWYYVVLDPETEPNKKTSGKLAITITSPNGYALTSAITVLDAG